VEVGLNIVWFGFLASLYLFCHLLVKIFLFRFFKQVNGQVLNVIYSKSSEVNQKYGVRKIIGKPNSRKYVSIVVRYQYQVRGEKNQQSYSLIVPYSFGELSYLSGASIKVNYLSIYPKISSPRLGVPFWIRRDYKLTFFIASILLIISIALTLLDK